MDYLLAEVYDVQSATYLLICVWDTTKEHASETLQSICSNKPIIDPAWSLNNFLSESMRARFALQQRMSERKDPSCYFSIALDRKTSVKVCL